MLAKARAGDNRAAGRAERVLSRGYAEYVLDLRRPTRSASTLFVDPALTRPPKSYRAVLDAAARAPSLRAHLEGVRRMNPLYVQLRTALAEHRTRWAALPRTPVPSGKSLAQGAKGERVRALRSRLGLSPGERYDAALVEAVKAFQTAHGLPADGKAGEATVAALNADPGRRERLILANMERTRALPADPGPRHLVVDIAAGRLWMYENGRPRDSMKVIVGKPETQTPVMAGVVRYAIFRPYWNIPEDLVRDRFAPRVLKDGIGVLERERMEVLSDWSDNPRVLKASTVDWRAAAAGRIGLRVRQKPGPENMMGRVKFMLPNDLGIYLHDTPDKAFFALEPRAFSAGCVRVEDSDRLTRWLFGRRAPAPGKTPEQQVALASPVPVFITYLTAAPTPEGGVRLQEDVYARDPALLAELGGKNGSGVVLASRDVRGR